MNTIDKGAKRIKRKKRIRAKVSGETTKPRLSVFRSSKHTYAQLVDDQTGSTLVCASTLDESFKGKSGKNSEAAQFVGSLIAKKAKEKGIERCVFDRNGYIYHGRVKALADKARESGLQF